MCALLHSNNTTIKVLRKKDNQVCIFPFLDPGESLLFRVLLIRSTPTIGLRSFFFF